MDTIHLVSPIRVKRQKIKCQRCDGSFTPRTQNQKYCSADCRKHVPVTLEYYTRDCAHCGEKFTYTQKQLKKKYCSKKCAQGEKTLSSGGDRWIILHRDGFRCAYCGASPMGDGIKLTLDHIIPVASGGGHTAENLISSCESCNFNKSARKMSQDNIDNIIIGIKNRNNEHAINPELYIKGPHVR